MGKTPLESYWEDYLERIKGVSQLKLVNETITSKAYQDNIKSDIKLQYECTMPLAFNKITHLAIALWNIHAFTRDQGGDIFELPPYSVDLALIDIDCSSVKRHVSWMSNIKDIFRNYFQIWCTLYPDESCIWLCQKASNLSLQLMVVLLSVRLHARFSLEMKSVSR